MEWIFQFRLWMNKSYRHREKRPDPYSLWASIYFPFVFKIFFFSSVHVCFLVFFLFISGSFLSWNPFVSNERPQQLVFRFFVPPFFIAMIGRSLVWHFGGSLGCFKFLARSAVLALWMMAIVTIKTVALAELLAFHLCSRFESENQSDKYCGLPKRNKTLWLLLSSFIFWVHFCLFFLDGGKRIEKEKQPRWLAVDWKWNETKRSNSCNAVSVLKVITQRNQKEKCVRIVLKWK